MPFEQKNFVKKALIGRVVFFKAKRVFVGKFIKEKTLKRKRFMFKRPYKNH